MAAHSKFNIKRDLITLYVGWYNKEFSVNDMYYRLPGDGVEMGLADLGETCTRIEMAHNLKRFSQNELIEIILNIVENAEEG